MSPTGERRKHQNALYSYNYELRQKYWNYVKNIRITPILCQKYQNYAKIFICSRTENWLKEITRENFHSTYG